MSRSDEARRRVDRGSSYRDLVTQATAKGRKNTRREANRHLCAQAHTDMAAYAAGWERVFGRRERR